MRTKRGIAIVWGLIYFIMLLAMYSTFNILVVSFLMIPPLILFVKLDRPLFLSTYIAANSAVYLVFGFGGLFATIISLFFLIPVIVMGNYYKKDKPAKTVVTGGIITLLSILVIAIIITAASGVNVTNELSAFLKESFDTVPAAIIGMVSSEQQAQLILLMTKMVPFYLILISSYYAIVTHFIGRRVLNRLDEKIAGMRPIRDWMLPKALVFYFLICLFLDYFITGDIDSVLTLILINSMPLLTIAFSIQAISFLSFVSYIKGWPRILPILCVVALIIVPVLSSIISLIGVFDVLFPLRKRIRKQ